jgi:sugar/nucleoside kinase (ribokinase family)
MKYDVYAIANAIVDLQVQLEEPEFASTGLEKGTYGMIDQEPQAKLLEKVGSFKTQRASGGSVANSALLIAQLGGKPAFSCVVGADDLGEFYVAEMNRLGVKTEGAYNDSLPTGTCACLITPDSHRTMRTYLGATTTFAAKNVSEHLLNESQWLFVEGYLFAQEDAKAAVALAVKKAKAAKKKIALTASDTFIINFFGEPLRKLIPDLDLLFVNKNECCALAETDDEEEAFRRMKSQVPILAMTRSAEGVWVSSPDGEFRVPGNKITPVDDTGAGDAFAGSFLYGITQGYDWEKTARLSCYLASKVVAKLGPRLEGDVKELVKAAGI